MAKLKRKSLPEQLAIAITKDIKAGVWRERLPGYRKLGERYDVGRRICENAIKILEASGVIAAPEAGKMRLILQRKIRNQASAKLRLLIITDRLHPPTPLDAELIVEVESFWKAEGGEVNRVTIDLMRTQKPDYQLKKWLKTPGADCLLFETIAPEWITPVEKLGLPCYAMGGSVGQSSGVLSGSGFKLAQHIGKILSKLMDMEHRRILLVMGRSTHESMKSAVHKQTAQILDEYQGSEKLSFSVMIPNLVNSTDWQNWWQKTLLKERPTVVITDSVYLGLSLHNFCLARGIQMPRDMSILVLDDADFLTWLIPAPARYRYKKKEAFRHFRSWVRGGFTQGSLKFFSADFIEGKTLGSAPQTSSQS